jgi:glycosyltransferase involved in cell wall biosynthesis
MVGPVAHDSLRFWYSGADVFCLASSREGWPNVILESLACGTPVVATSAGGIPEIIRSDALGLLTERDEASIAGAIYRALKKSWRADDLVAYARNHAWDHTSLAVLGVFQSILGRRNPLVVLKTSDCRLLKKLSEARRVKNRRAQAYLGSTLERGD